MGTDLVLWLIFPVGAIILWLIVRIYVVYVRQCRLQSTFDILDFLGRNISKDQIATFVELFHANSELNGAGVNQFKLADGRVDTIETMFEEGGCGNGDIYNLITIFNAVTPFLNGTEEKIVWYEYAQIMIILYKWTDYLEKKTDNEGRVSFFLDFNKYMKKNSDKIVSAPYKIYT